MQVTHILFLSFLLILGMRGGFEQRNLKWESEWGGVGDDMDCLWIRTVTRYSETNKKHGRGVIKRT